MAMVSYKTPGVYVQEIDAFPPSIVGVQTAVPVFIGYTEKAQKGSTSVTGRPVAITSLVEFATTFGGGFRRTFGLTKVTTPDATGSATTDAAATPARPAANAAAAAAAAAANKVTAAASPSLDVMLGDTAYKLDHVSKSKFYLYDSLRLFYANGGGPCYVVSVGSYADADAGVAKDDLSTGLAAVEDLVGPTMLVIPDATLVEDKASYDTLVVEMMNQCGRQQDRVAILDVWNGATATTSDDVTAAIDGFRVGANKIAAEYLRYGMSYFPFLNTSIVEAREITYANFDLATAGLATLKAALKDEARRLYPAPPAAPGAAAAATTTGRTSGAADAADADATPSSPKATEIGALIDKLAAPGDGGIDMPLNQALTANLPVLADLYAYMAAQQGVLPPCGAMAGVYTANDTLRGVWNAPANVGLVAVNSPTVRINNARQDDMNVPIDGLAINAIRDFVGRGTVVWGARTLDGNSNDWRFIQVRRALIYIEESAKLALNKFVFAPNVGQTWVTVTAMINTFLQQMWSQGGLMGATASEAFQVQCGLGSTMTPQDILEGRMIVQIQLQLVRPAEFIILTFKQEMRGGA